MFHAPNSVLKVFAWGSLAATAAIGSVAALDILPATRHLLDPDLTALAMLIGLIAAPVLAGANVIIAVTADHRETDAPRRVAWAAVVVCTLVAVVCFVSLRAAHGHWG